VACGLSWPGSKVVDAVAIDQECVGYAFECVRLAGLTEDQQIRERLLEMARDWSALAGEADKWKRGQADRKIR
jgi:hypothetical protein